jgi:hypothetical protein
MTTLQTTPAPTFDDVWRIIQELANTQKETERSIKEADLRYQAMREEFAREAKERDEKTAREAKERDEKTAREAKERDEKTAREAKERVREAKERDEKTAREAEERVHEAKERAREAKERDKETDRMIKAVNKQIGDLGGRLGQFVEEMVRPAAVRLFRQRGLDVHQVMKNLTAYDDFGQYRTEVDLLVINNKTAISVECKSHLSIDDVNEHLERMNIFKDCFPQYAEFSLLGAVAAMVIPDDVGRYAYKQGLFVMAQNGEAMLIKNDDKFNPKTW